MTGSVLMSSREHGMNAVADRNPQEESGIDV